MGLCGLLQGYLYFFILVRLLNEMTVVCTVASTHSSLLTADLNNEIVINIFNMRVI
jgi:hypothetical protein